MGSKNNSKRAVITGITGQDGSYLAELLLAEGYLVHGIVRRSSRTVRPRLDHLTCDDSVYRQRLFLHYADLEDLTTLRRLLVDIQPHEVYHLAGQSHVGVSFEIPESTCDFTAMGTLRLLEVMRDLRPSPRFLHTSSSEIFGHPTVVPQHEETPHVPITPYGAAKSFATNMVRIYREAFELFACNAICFNHESPRRGESFVTRKITQSAARIKLGLQTELPLGNIDAQRDWGYAPDYVRGFFALLQADAPTDCVFATGTLHRVRDWLEIAFGHLDLDWTEYVVFDSRFQRKADPARLVGDAGKARRLLGWQPEKSFEAMVVEMVEHDMAVQRELVRSLPGR